MIHFLREPEPPMPSIESVQSIPTLLLGYSPDRFIRSVRRVAFQQSVPITSRRITAHVLTLIPKVDSELQHLLMRALSRRLGTWAGEWACAAGGIGFFEKELRVRLESAAHYVDALPYEPEAKVIANLPLGWLAGAGGWSVKRSPRAEQWLVGQLQRILRGELSGYSVLTRAQREALESVENGRCNLYDLGRVGCAERTLVVAPGMGQTRRWKTFLSRSRRLLHEARSLDRRGDRLAARLVREQAERLPPDTLFPG